VRLMELVWTTSRTDDRACYPNLDRLAVASSDCLRRQVDRCCLGFSVRSDKRARPGLLGTRRRLQIASLLVRMGLTICQSPAAGAGSEGKDPDLEKALTLISLSSEDSEFYDKMTRARREASSPVSYEPHLQASPGWSIT